MLALALVLQSIVGPPAATQPPPPPPVVESHVWRFGAERLYKAKWNGTRWAPLTQTVYFSFGNYDTTTSIAQFDDGGIYTLSEAAINGTADYSHYLYCEETQNEPGWWDVGNHATYGHTALQVRLPSAGTLLVNDSGTHSPVRINVDAYDGVTDFDPTVGPSGTNSGTSLNISHAVALKRVQASGPLMEMTGTGNLACPIVRTLVDPGTNAYPGGMIVGWAMYASLSSGSCLYTY